MAAILDLVNKAWTYVAELYFIGFVDPQNISLGTKSIFLAGLEIEISQKLDLVTGHGGHFEKRIFFIVWTLLERVTRSNIFPHIKIYPKKSRNLICLIWRRKIIFFKWPRDYTCDPTNPAQKQQFKFQINKQEASRPDSSAT